MTNIFSLKYTPRDFHGFQIDNSEPASNYQINLKCKELSTSSTKFGPINWNYPTKINCIFLKKNCNTDIPYSYSKHVWNIRTKRLSACLSEHSRTMVSQSVEEHQERAKKRAQEINLYGRGSP